MPLVRNSWYVAAEPGEIEGRLLARTILDEPVVLFRTASGTPVALHDRCPHRFMPLSRGQVTGETIRCSYHGARFDRAGSCTGIPGLQQIPERVRVRSYPLAKRHGWLWIWMGDPQLADAASIPANAWFGDPAHPVWKSGWNCFESLPVGYQLIGDNLMDVTHAESIHPESFGFPVAEMARRMREGDGPAPREVTYRVDLAGRRISFWLCETGELTEFYHEAVGRRHRKARQDGDLEFVMHVEFNAPSCFSFLLKIKPLGRPDTDGIALSYLHMLTPESETSTHYFYRACHDTGDDALTEWAIGGANFIFNQDKVVLEAQQRALGDRDAWTFRDRPVVLPGDNLAVYVRTIVRSMLGSNDVSGDTGTAV